MQIHGGEPIILLRISKTIAGGEAQSPYEILFLKFVIDASHGWK